MYQNTTFNRCAYYVLIYYIYYRFIYIVVYGIYIGVYNRYKYATLYSMYMCIYVCMYVRMCVNLPADNFCSIIIKWAPSSVSLTHALHFAVLSVCASVCVWVGDHVLGATAHQFSLFISLFLSHSYYTTPLSMQCIFKDVQIDPPPPHTLLIQQRVAAAQLA